MPVLETEDEFPLQVDLGEFGGLLEFQKPEDAETWIKKEIQFWDWTKSAEVRNIQELTQTRSTISNTLNNLNENIKHWRESAPDSARTYVEQIENIFAGFQTNRARTGLLSGTPEALAVDLVRKESDDFNGLVALAYALNRIKNVLQTPIYLPGFVL